MLARYRILFSIPLAGFAVIAAHFLFDARPVVLGITFMVALLIGTAIGIFLKK